MQTPDLRRAPATARNREPILEVLAQALPKAGLVLEVASGTGEHAVFMAPRLSPELSWQPTDTDPEALATIDGHVRSSPCDRILPAIQLDARQAVWPVAKADALFCCNMIHIAPWEAAEGLFAGAAGILSPGAPLVLYGPFKRHGVHTAPSNESFDAGLRARDSRWGVRCLETDVAPLAARNGFVIEEIVPMPANNFTVVFRRT